MTTLTTLSTLLLDLQGLSKLKPVLPFAAGILGFSLIIPLIAKAEVETLVGTCNKHGWILQDETHSVSIGKSHDLIVTDGYETHKGEWTYTNLPGVVKLYYPNTDQTVFIYPECADGESRFGPAYGR